jgi:hypothetical protein
VYALALFLPYPSFSLRCFRRRPYQLRLRRLQIKRNDGEYDVTHAIAIMLEKLYKKDATFIKLTKDMGLMRLQLCCSKHAHIMPPNQRSKSRFLNLDIISK